MSSVSLALSLEVCCLLHLILCGLFLRFLGALGEPALAIKLRAVDVHVTLRVFTNTKLPRPPDPRQSPHLPANLPNLQPRLHRPRAPKTLERPLLLYYSPFSTPSPQISTNHPQPRHVALRPAPPSTTPCSLPLAPPPPPPNDPLPPLPHRLLDDHRPRMDLYRCPPPGQVPPPHPLLHQRRLCLSRAPGLEVRFGAGVSAAD